SHDCRDSCSADGEPQGLSRLLTQHLHLRPLQGMAQHGEERCWAKRLLHESRHALSSKALLHLMLTIAAHHNGAYVWPHLSQVLQDLLTIHLGHRQIQNHHSYVLAVTTEHVYTVAAIVRQHHVEARSLKDRLDQVADLRFILHHQDGTAAHPWWGCRRHLT